MDNRLSDIEKSFFDKLSDISDSTNKNSATLVRMDEGLKLIKEDVSELKREASDIKEDVSDLQTDVKILKIEVSRIGENTEPDRKSENVVFFPE
ncbi:MAG: hypothetical protein OXF73_07835 [Gammaproteobacteria bacterium]|nr:hypothetical protein [Gammaproteobacteria bacterium]